MKLIFKTTHCNKYSINTLAKAIENREDEVFFESNAERIIQMADENSIVIFSFMNMNAEQEIKDALKIKNKKHGVKMIAGGPYFTPKTQNPQNIFDFIFTGEGEETINDFLNGKISSKYIKSQNDVDINRYGSVSEKYKRFGSIEISRGCHHSCFYCQTPYLFSQRMRHKTTQKIVQEIEILLRNNFKDIRFITPDIASYGSNEKGKPNIKKIKELFSAIKETIKNRARVFLGSFPSEIRPENVTEEFAFELKQITSSKTIILGAQSGSERVLKKINRGHSVNDIIRAADILFSAGFKIDMDFIFGFPFETDEDIKQTQKLIAFIVKKYNARIHIHYFMPLPSTPFENLIPRPLSYELRRYLSGLTSSKIAYGQWEKQINRT